MPAKAASPGQAREASVRRAGKPAGELVIGDEGRCVLLEGGVAEHVIWMHVVLIT
jgi:hypothetical protein